MILNNKQIAVIGGGPGGLTLAALLQLNGAAVKVYERDLDSLARVQGSPLDMHEDSGWTALRRANLVDEFKKNVRHGADKKIIVNEQAEILFSDHDANINKNAAPEPSRPEIDRGALRKIFLEALKPGTIHWDSHVISMSPQKDGWSLHFKNGASAYADLVIGSDGANSKIRPYVTTIKAFYSGITMVEINVDHAASSVPTLHQLLNGGKIMAFGNRKNILGGQKNSDGLGFYMSFKCDENWDTTSGLDFSDRLQLLTWFKKQYREWGSIWYELFENASTPAIPRPIYCMPLEQNWDALPNLTLLGDAAHVMPPFAGEGANTSMYDALELSDCLTSGRYPTMHEAIAAYETTMRRRASKAAKQSLENGERMHSEDALQKMMAVYGGRSGKSLS